MNEWLVSILISILMATKTSCRIAVPVCPSCYIKHPSENKAIWKQTKKAHWSLSLTSCAADQYVPVLASPGRETLELPDFDLPVISNVPLSSTLLPMATPLNTSVNGGHCLLFVHPASPPLHTRAYTACLISFLWAEPGTGLLSLSGLSVTH